MKATSKFPPKRILLPTDLSEGSLVAIRLGLTIAIEHRAQVDVLTIFEEFPQDVYGDLDYFNDTMIQRVREQIHQALEKIKIPQEIRKNIRIFIRKGSPAQEIGAHLKKNFNDLIVMATHGRVGVKRIRYGSVTEEVLMSCQTPILVIKPYSKKREFHPQKILIPLDFSPRDNFTLKYAKSLKENYKSGLHLLHAIPEVSSEIFSLRTPTSLKKSCREKLTQYFSRLKTKGVSSVELGSPAHVILEKTETTEIDLILMTARNKSSRLFGFLGSVSSKVARHAECDVLFLHPK